MPGIEVFWCNKCKALMRGKDISSGPGPDGGQLVEARCVVCEAKVYKSIYPEPVEENLTPETETGLPHGSQKPHGGYPDRPSAQLWAVFISSVEAILPETMRQNAARVASLLWYEHTTVEQRRAFIKEFEERGTVSIPVEDLRFGRSNPEIRMNPHPISVDAKKVLAKLADYFWAGKRCIASVYDWDFTVQVETQWNKPRDIGAIRLFANGIELALLTVDHPSGSFGLSLFDGLFYSHRRFKSLVKEPSLVIVGSLMLLLERAPVKGLGTLSYKKGILSHSSSKWDTAEPFFMHIPFKSVKSGPLLRITKVELPTEKGLSELPVMDIERVQKKLEAKTEEYTRYIEALYEGDPEAAKAEPLDPLQVARLKGDEDYEKLLMVRDMLLRDEEEVPEDLLLSVLKPAD